MTQPAHPSQLLGLLFALAEAYPQLRAVENLEFRQYLYVS